MPHRCVRCSKLYEDGAKEILSGCNCGAKLFLYVRKERLEESKKITTNLTIDEKKQIESDVFDIVGLDKNRDEPVVLDLESIRILKPGKYELDLVNLFRKRPVIYKLAEGKYVIDLPETFKSMQEDK